MAEPRRARDRRRRPAQRRGQAEQTAPARGGRSPLLAALLLEERHDWVLRAARLGTDDLPLAAPGAAGPDDRAVDAGDEPSRRHRRPAADARGPRTSGIPAPAVTCELVLIPEHISCVKRERYQISPAASRARRHCRGTAYGGNPAAWRAPSGSAKDWTRTTRPSRTVKSDDRVSSTSSSCVRPTMCTTTAT